MSTEHPAFGFLRSRADSYLLKRIDDFGGEAIFVEGKGVPGLQPHSPIAMGLESDLLEVRKDRDTFSPQGVSLVEVFRSVISGAEDLSFEVSVTHGRGKQHGKTYTKLTAKPM